MAKIIKIEALMNSSERRFFSEAQLTADPALAAEGWERRFTADAQRVEEALALYAQLGYEVRAVPLPPGEFDDDCTDCHAVIAREFKTIYTRRKSAKHDL